MAFEIENAVLKKYIAEDGETSVTIPNSVTSIGDCVFLIVKVLKKLQ